MMTKADTHSLIKCAGDKAVIIEKTMAFIRKRIMGVPSDFHAKYEAGSGMKPLNNSIID